MRSAPRYLICRLADASDQTVDQNAPNADPAGRRLGACG
jgi:hypothetical protein